MSQGVIRVSPIGVAGVYLFAFLLMMWPLVDLCITAWPPQPGSAPWRFGFSGLLADVHHTVLLGLVVAMIVAYAQGHRRFFRALAVLALAGALILLVILVLFPLDVLQVRAGAPEGARATIQAGGLLTEGKHFTALLALGLLGVGAWKSTALRLWESPSSGSGRTADLLVKPSRKVPEKPAE